RDVKPGNMLRTTDGHTKVCDFGIAKRFEQDGDDVQGAKNTTLAKGTAQYISPEQCDLQGRVDRRADVYSLGVMMYEMLAGRLPFTEGILIMQHLQMDPPPLTVIGKYRNPDELCGVVARCMQKRPEDRFQSMKELAQELVRISKLEPQKKSHKSVVISTIPQEWHDDPHRAIVGPGKSRTVSGAQPIPRSRANKAMMVGVPLLLVSVAVLAIVFWPKAPGPKPEPVTPGVVEDNRWLDTKNNARLAINREDWDGFGKIDLSPLEDQPLELKVLRDDIRQRASFVLSQNLSSTSDWRDRLARLTTMSSALAHAGAPDESVAAVRDFAAALEPFGKDSAAGEYQAWRDEMPATVDTQVSQIVGVLESENAPQIKSTWRDFVEREQRRRLDANRDWLLAAWKRAADDSDAAVDPQIQSRTSEVLTRLDAIKASTSDIAQQMQRWFTQRAKAQSSPSALLAFLRGPGLKLAGGSEADLFRLIEDRARLFGASDRVQTPLEALAMAAVSAESEPAFVEGLKTSLGSDPAAWPAAIRRLENEDGVPTSLYRASLTEALIQSIQNDLSLKRRLDERAQGQDPKDFAKTIDAEMASVYAALGSLSGKQQTGLEGAWSRRTAEWRRKDVDRAWSDVEGVRREFEANPSYDQPTLRKLFETYRNFVNNYEDHPEVRNLKGHAFQVLEQLRRNENWLGLMVLASSNSGLVSDFARVTEEARKGLERALAQGPPQSEYFIKGLDEADGPRLYRVVNEQTLFNAAWLASDLPCVELVLPIPGRESELARPETLRVRGGDGVDVEWTRTGQLRLQFAPRLAGKQGSRMADGRLWFEVPILIDSESLGLGTMPLSLRLPGPKSEACDFESPRLEVRFDRRAAAGKLGLTVEVRDDRPRELGGLAAQVIVNGMPLKSSEGSTPGEFAYELRLEDLPAATELSGSAVALDRAGNRSQPQDLAQDLAYARSNLVDDLDKGLRERVQRLFVGRNQSSLDATALAESSRLVTGMRSDLERLKGYDASLSAELGKELVGRELFDWLSASWTGIHSESKLNAVDSDVQSLVSAMRSFERDLGSDGSATKLIEEAWRDTKKRATAPPVVRDDPPVIPTERPTPVKDPPKPEPVRSSYKTTSPISVFGLNFVRVVTEDQDPAWVCTTELSVADAERLFGGDFVGQARSNVGKFPGAKWTLRGNQALAPVSIDMVKIALTALNASGELAQIEAQLGGKLEVDVPTEKEWEAAARHAAGGNAKFPWGNGGVPRHLTSDQAGNKRFNWFDGVLDVTADRTGRDFHHLSGNVGDLVRTSRGGSSLKMRGGTIQDASEPDARRNERLEIDGRAEPIQRSRGCEMLSGMRLVIVPRS
ncbi:MAG: serine/threonine protein kinase, partial [Planctomycetes bacterium]|nr:serine/threonine protein kinase [Planctomycetota bacterium]